MANFDIPRLCNFDFLAKIINLRIYKGLDRENRLGCNCSHYSGSIDLLVILKANVDRTIFRYNL